MTSHVRSVLVKRLFIEVQYDPELPEVEEIDYSGMGETLTLPRP